VNIGWISKTKSSRTEDTPLVLSCRSRGLARITNEAASEALKAVLGAAALAASADGDSDTAAVLRLASAHWLRHSMVTNHANIAGKGIL
jgi:integrase/recombinase XerD